MAPDTEELDLAEVLAYRHADTPLWNGLLADYDAETLDGIASGWAHRAPDDGDVPGDDDEPDYEDEDLPEDEPEDAIPGA